MQGNFFAYMNKLYSGFSFGGFSDTNSSWIKLNVVKCHLSAISLSTIILQALQRSILLGENQKFIPVIFLEWDKVVRCFNYLRSTSHFCN